MARETMGALGEVARDNEYEILLGQKLADLNIKKEELEQIEGFAELSEGQRLMALDNLRQLQAAAVVDKAEQKTVGLKRSMAEAKTKDEASGQVKTDYGRAGKVILHNLIAGIKNIGGRQSAIFEKVEAKELREAGFSAHKALLQELVNGLKNQGPAIELKNGDLTRTYISAEDNARDNEKQATLQINREADSFAGFSYEKGQGGHILNRRNYEKAKKAFDRACDGWGEAMLKDGADEQSVLLKISQLRHQVLMDQFLNRHPGVDAGLAQIQDQNVWAKAAKNTVTEKGLYFAAGAAIRTTSVALLNALPVVGAGISGGLFGYLRARKQQRESDSKARFGAEQSGDTAKDFADAEAYADEINWLVEEIKEESDFLDPDQKSTAVNRAIEIRKNLKHSVEEAAEKLADGTVNFGPPVEAVRNQYKLVEALSLGQAFVMAEEAKRTKENLFEPDGDPKAKLFAYMSAEYQAQMPELKDYIEKLSRKAKSARDKQAFRKVLSGAALGAGFFMAGRAVRDNFHHATKMFEGFGSAEAPKAPIYSGRISADDTVVVKPDADLPASPQTEAGTDQSVIVSKTPESDSAARADAGADYIIQEQTNQSPVEETEPALKVPEDPIIVPKTESAREELAEAMRSRPMDAEKEAQMEALKPVGMNPEKQKQMNALSALQTAEAGEKITVPDMAVIGKGEGITHAIKRQILADPKHWGYEKDSGDLDRWAAGESKKYAASAGYIDLKTGAEVRVGGVGVGKAAYVLNENGSVSEYLLSEKDGQFVKLKDHPLGRVFDEQNKNAHEYIQEKQYHDHLKKTSDSLAKAQQETEYPQGTFTRGQIPDQNQVLPSAPLDSAPEAAASTDEIQPQAHLNLDSRLNQEFRIGRFSSQGWEEMSVFKQLPAEQVMYGQVPAVGSSAEKAIVDGAEKTHLNNLRQYLSEAKSRLGEPRSGELTRDYLLRYEQAKLGGAKVLDIDPEELSQPAETKVLETPSPAKTINPAQELVIGTGLKLENFSESGLKNLRALGVEDEEFTRAIQDKQASFFTGDERQGKLVPDKEQWQKGIVRIEQPSQYYKFLEIDFNRKEFILYFNEDSEAKRTLAWWQNKNYDISKLRASINSAVREDKR
jgi:hypothetical protein